jgi:hypothetical protein
MVVLTAVKLAMAVPFVSNVVVRMVMLEMVRSDAFRFQLHLWRRPDAEI